MAPNRFAVLLFSISILIHQNAAAAEKIRNWHTGKVLDSQQNRYFPASANTKRTATGWEYEMFAIEGDTYAYLAQERLHWRWSEPANLTVSGPVKYAEQKRKLFVIDNAGNEHEMEIVTKILKVGDPAT